MKLICGKTATGQQASLVLGVWREPRELRAVWRMCCGVKPVGMPPKSISEEVGLAVLVRACQVGHAMC